jgi:tetratricopeptide (TPR) repeat protein
MSLETAVKADISEAQRLYQRGLAAARGGQKRVAAGLLTRSLQLDPHNELAWLWLSGVLEDPRQQAFCLQAALRINPTNQHALRGLRVLEERKLLDGGAQPSPGLGLSQSQPTEDLADRAPSAQHESWWVSWRRRRRDISRARVLLWVFPLIAVGLAIILNRMIALAVTPAPPAPVATVVLSAISSAPPPTPTIEPILEAEPLSVVEGFTISYLGALGPMRAGLRAATTAYRSVTSQPGGSVGYVAATQRLRATVQQALDDMGHLRPPRTLQQAHDDYRKGLELETQGLDAILEFYGGYDVANANRAAQRFQESRAYIERASASFSARAQQLAQLSSVSPNTAR